MRKRSRCLFISVLIATLYLVYLIVYFTGVLETGDTGSGIATILVLPHTIVLAIGVLFGWLSYVYRFTWAALTAAILYCVSSLLFVVYAMFLILPIIFGFVGYINQKKLNVQNGK